MPTQSGRAKRHFDHSPNGHDENNPSVLRLDKPISETGNLGQQATRPRAITSSHGFVLERQPYYCEENIWRLCQLPFLASRPRHVVFISNEQRAVVMWNQRTGAGRPVVWDYHVILVADDPREVWDVDTMLGIPIDPLDYMENSFHPGLPEPYLPRFRMIEADLFVELFASDRSHMRTPDGTYLHPPPPWPQIGKTGAMSNLMQFVDMEQPFLGEVLSLFGFVQRFVFHCGDGHQGRNFSTP